MGAIADLWKSERGILAVILVAVAGVLAGLGYMTVPEWTEFAKWIFVTYTAGKTVTGAVQIVKGSSEPAVKESPATATPSDPTTSPAPIPG